MPPLSLLFKVFAARDQKRQVAWLMAGSFLFLVLSTPLNLMHGFLFAEEGTTYLRYAWLARPSLALLAPHQQYFALFPNVLALVEARVLPLAWAAVFSAWMVLLVHLLLVYMVAECERFTESVTRLLAVVLVLLAPGAAVVVVGSTQTQFVFALLCVLVLISDVERLPVLRTLCVLLGGFDGLVSCMLTPFFLYRAWRTSSSVAWTQASILSVCSLIQGAVLIHALPFASRGAIVHRSPFELLNVLSNHILMLPYLTRFVYHPTSLLGTASAVFFWSFASASLIGFILLATLIWPAGRWARLLLLIAGVHALCSIAGMEGEYRSILGGGERYFFVANAAIAFALLLRWQQLRFTAPASTTGTMTIASSLLLLLVLSGVADELRFWKLNQSGEIWRDEIRAWKLDPSHVTLTANPKFWNEHRMHLPPQPLSLDLPFYIFDSNVIAPPKAFPEF